jgi:oxalate decarboxylase/phosphoglucose isomerase-like protein (cupin superfamily)
MQAFKLSELASRRKDSRRPYLEFLRVPSLSSGLYVLDAGKTDPQGPHDEDEVYYVISGRARMRVRDEDREVGPGTIIYVPARVDHRFHDIMEDLQVLVFFAPAETRSSG